ncbi:MAG: IPT/TIG domain-containing protein, partial [bacterium]
VGSANQGRSVSISADGNTAIVGGYKDFSKVGAAWVYTRNGGVWTQQGNSLVGTGAVGNARHGSSVSISADGNTAIVGGINDNSGVGAAWVYTRSGGVWTQQGNKLVGSGATMSANQGFSVSISADGNTAIVGGYYDNSGVGAAWVFTRSGGVWTQQGNKLVGAGALGKAQQGISVSISADGNTAIVGGWGDNSGVGASWVYTYLPPPAPTITSFAPVTAAAGAVISITGTNFTGTSAITLGGTPVTSFTVVSFTSIVAIVGNGSTGSVGVTSAGGSASVSGFTFIPAPVISSFNPTSAGLGTAITITGSNLTGATSVILGGTPVTSFTVVSSSTITAIVGNGSTGSVGVTSAGGSASLSGFTFIPAPVISSINPTTAGLGTSITITGNNLTGATSVSLGGTPVTSFTVVSSSTITAIVGNGSTGSVGVTS